MRILMLILLIYRCVFILYLDEYVVMTKECKLYTLSLKSLSDSKLQLIICMILKIIIIKVKHFNALVMIS